MRNYRIQVTATVCFSIDAETNDEAIHRAAEVVDIYQAGLSIPAGNELGMRLYIDEDSDLDIVDFEEKEIES